MNDFKYRVPQSLDEALSLLQKRKTAKILAGGTDLIVLMKDKRINPAEIIDVKRVPELNRLELGNDKVLHVGAAVPLSDIIAFPAVIQDFSLLRQACSVIGAERIRNRATMGGNICNAAPSADSAPALLCLEAKAIIARLGGARVVPMESFFTCPGQTCLEDGEILVEVEIPAPPTNSAGYYMRLSTREEMDIAVAGAACLLAGCTDQQIHEARISLGAVAPTPIRVTEAEAFLEGKVLNDELILKASEIATAAGAPISDVRASAEYRREMVKVLVRRTLQKSWAALNTHN